LNVEAWRILKAKHAASAFTGQGAADHGGRWNSRGVPVVYCSQSKALAALESLVHLNPPVRFEYVAIRVAFDASMVAWFPMRKLPDNWRTEPPPPPTQKVGDLWIKSAQSAVLALPSAIIPGEFNFLLNPAHPDFAKVVRGKPETFVFDPRLLG
jgi:RES domain-containing protein